MKIHTKLFFIVISLISISLCSSEISQAGTDNPAIVTKQAEINILQKQLEQKQSITTKLKRLLISMLVPGFGIPAGLLGLAATGGALYSPSALKNVIASSPNQLTQNISPFVQTIVNKGANLIFNALNVSYSGLLQHFYFTHIPSIPIIEPSGLWDIEGASNAARYTIYEAIIQKALKSPENSNDATIALGLLAPLTGVAAITFGFIAKHLWNKLRNYYQEINDLKKKIEYKKNLVELIQGQ